MAHHLDYIKLTNSPSEVLTKVLEEMSFSKLAVIADENTSEHCLPLLDLPDHLLIKISSGEKEKNLDTCQKLWSDLTDATFDRNCVVINLGGGVIGDMGGFVAATFKRGIRFINIPTTLLAQVDASIGGKLGIDFQGLKNHIGVFQLPHCVIVSPVFLTTLSKRELLSGFAEVIKHGLIYDCDYYEALKHPDQYSQDELLNLLKGSVDIKNSIVEKDPFEKADRKLLNFGHTIGHTVETCTLHEAAPLLHGEAIAVGMICESWLSMKYTQLPTDQAEEIFNYISSLYPKVNLSALDHDKFLQVLQQDKKNIGNSIQASLLSTIGSAQFGVEITREDAWASIEFYLSN